ncbi:monovalent cation/H(+) antiporter subunit G [Micromonospora matsumotoense]|uniref:monovalent cation/H(+) antiporter subunit G n=1 Tax=Micromonospora matsumotoense TaxID=121616 RepID=UPI00341AA356
MSVGTVVDWLAAVALVSGALLSLAAGIGVLRFPDVLDRMHAATKPQVLGVLLLLVGLALRLRTAADLGMIVLVGVFQLATAPVAAQMIGRAAYRSGRVDRSLLDVDELAEHQPEDGGSRPEGSGSRSEHGEQRRGGSRSGRGEQRRGGSRSEPGE